VAPASPVPRNNLFIVALLGYERDLFPVVFFCALVVEEAITTPILSLGSVPIFCTLVASPSKGAVGESASISGASTGSELASGKSDARLTNNIKVLSRSFVIASVSSPAVTTSMYLCVGAPMVARSRSMH